MTDDFLHRHPGIAAQLKAFCDVVHHAHHMLEGCELDAADAPDQDGMMLLVLRANWEALDNALGTLDDLGEWHGEEIIATVLTILKLHEADLAGVSRDDAMNAVAPVLSTKSDAVEVAGILIEQCAAAYLAGRAAGREEAAKVADEYEDDARTIIASVAAEEIATAIRSLP